MSAIARRTSALDRAPVPALKPGAIYFSDNGQLICLRCAGQSAKYTGRDLSGQCVLETTQADADAWFQMFGRVMACEAGCTKHVGSGAMVIS